MSSFLLMKQCAVHVWLSMQEKSVERSLSLCDLLLRLLLNILPKRPLAGQSQRCNFFDKIHGFSPLCEINFR